MWKGVGGVRLGLVHAEDYLNPRVVTSLVDALQPPIMKALLPCLLQWMVFAVIHPIAVFCFHPDSLALFSTFSVLENLTTPGNESQDATIGADVVAIICCGIYGKVGGSVHVRWLSNLRR